MKIKELQQTIGTLKASYDALKSVTLPENSFILRDLQREIRTLEEKILRNKTLKKNNEKVLNVLEELLSILDREGVSMSFQAKDDDYSDEPHDVLLFDVGVWPEEGYSRHEIILCENWGSVNVARLKKRIEELSE